jgi:hypothetical protein
VNKYSTARQATDDNIMWLMRGDRGKKHTLKTCNTSCFARNNAYANAPQCYVYTYTAWLFHIPMPHVAVNSALIRFYDVGIHFHKSPISYFTKICPILANACKQTAMTKPLGTSSDIQNCSEFVTAKHHASKYSDVCLQCTNIKMVLNKTPSLCAVGLYLTYIGTTLYTFMLYNFTINFFLNFYQTVKVQCQ